VNVIEPQRILDNKQPHARLVKREYPGWPGPFDERTRRLAAFFGSRNLYRVENADVASLYAAALLERIAKDPRIDRAVQEQFVAQLPASLWDVEAITGEILRSVGLRFEWLTIFATLILQRGAFLPPDCSVYYRIAEPSTRSVERIAGEPHTRHVRPATAVAVRPGHRRPGPSRVSNSERNIDWWYRYYIADPHVSVPELVAEYMSDGVARADPRKTVTRRRDLANSVLQQIGKGGAEYISLAFVPPPGAGGFNGTSLSS
jgi:hypothetical protein